jgi:ornithine cyclodeaminase
MALHFLSAADVHALVSLEDVLNTQRQVFAAMHRGEALLAPRALLPGDHESVAFAYLARAGKGLPAVVKMGSINPANAALGKPAIHATILVSNEVTGELHTIIDGESVTLMRTAAASAIAVETFTATAPSTFGFIGSGPQIMSHMEYLHELFPAASFCTFARNADRAKALIAFASEHGMELSLAQSAREAVEGADVVITATNSTTPLLEASWLSTTQLLVSIGSFGPGRCEYGQDVVKAASTIAVDDVETSILQAGPLVEAIAAGILDPRSLVSFGEKLDQGFRRTSTDDRWIYNSVGIGIQDAALAGLLMQRAEGSKFGRTIEV